MIGEKTRNFGDYLSEFFLHNMFLHSKTEADLFQFVGSVLDGRVIESDLKRAIGSLNGYIAYWCCGARSSNPIPQRIRSRIMIFGVRGPLTRDALSLPTSTVMGDPGFLLPLLHKARKHSAFDGKTVCIPHILDKRDDATLLAMAGTDLILSPVIEGNDEGLREIIDKIVSAKFVLSASLHGAIVAASYGVPFAFWGNGHLDVPFKWEDLSASISIPALFPQNLHEAQLVWNDQLADRIKLPALAPMLQVCPFTVSPAVMLAALAHDGLIPTQTAEQVATVWTASAVAAGITVTNLNDHSIAFRARRESLFHSPHRRISRVYQLLRRSVGDLVRARRRGAMR
jgi:hypothetical protein